MEKNIKEDTRNDFSGDNIAIKNVYTKGDVVYACSSSYGLYVSKNNCANWINYTAVSDTVANNVGMHKTGMLSNCVRDVYVDDNGFVYVATDKGVSISFDNCTKWTNQIINGDVGQDGVNRIAVGDGKIYAATADNGVYTLVFASGEIIRHDKNTADSGGVSCVHGIHVGTSRDVMCANNNPIVDDSDHAVSSPSKVLPVYISCVVDNKEKLKVSYDCGLTWITIIDGVGPFNRLACFTSDSSSYGFVPCIFMTLIDGTVSNFHSSNNDSDCPYPGYPDHALSVFTGGVFITIKDNQPPFGVCSIARAGDFIYAGSANKDAKICIGKVNDVLRSISWSTYQINVLHPDNTDSKKIIAMAVSSNSAIYALFGDNLLYVSTDSSAHWTHVNNFSSSVSTS